jgi:hypothetical protein
MVQPKCEMGDSFQGCQTVCQLRHVYGCGQIVLPGQAHGTSTLGDPMKRNSR